MQRNGKTGRWGTGSQALAGADPGDAEAGAGADAEAEAGARAEEAAPGEGAAADRGGEEAAAAGTAKVAQKDCRLYTTWGSSAIRLP